MGQVPKISRVETGKLGDESYAFDSLIIGSGRVAKHLQRYFSLLEVPVVSWCRKVSPLSELKELASLARVHLLAVSDSAIEELARELPLDSGQQQVHFSGALSLSGVHGVHPFSSFSHRLWELPDYKELLFVCEEGTPFLDLFPHFENPHIYISQENKARYHAQCVLLANGLGLLLRDGHRHLQDMVDLREDDALKFCESVFKNYLSSPEAFLTGPIIRGDHVTMEANLNALTDEKWKQLYRWLQNYSKEGLSE